MDSENRSSSSASSGADTAAGDLVAARLTAIARTLYVEGPIVLRKLQHWRPYICPFERLVRHVQSGARVLDVGCGGGLLLGLIAGLGLEFEGLGVDVSRRAIDIAKRMAGRAAAVTPRARLGFECLEHDAAWPAQQFDVVFLVDVLHHIPPGGQRRFLSRSVSNVKPGGILVYKDMCLRPRWKAFANRLHDLVVAREWIHYAPVETVEEWARSEGMEIIGREEVGRMWYGHELRVMRRPALGERRPSDADA